YQKSAEAGNSHAQYDLATYYEEGIGVEIDLEKAVHWYQKSAKAGNSKAQYKLAGSYQRGIEVEIDLKKAVHLYQKSTETVNGDLNFICTECLSPHNTSCKNCLVMHCKETFQSSGSEEIDTILEYSRSHISDPTQILEYIPFTHFAIINK